jgi:hypothetical protein
MLRYSIFEKYQSKTIKMKLSKTSIVILDSIADIAVSVLIGAGQIHSVSAPIQACRFASLDLKTTVFYRYETSRNCCILARIFLYPSANSPVFRANWFQPPDDGFFDQWARWNGAFGTEDWTEAWTYWAQEGDLKP